MWKNIVLKILLMPTNLVSFLRSSLKKLWFKNATNVKPPNLSKNALECYSAVWFNSLASFNPFSCRICVLVKLLNTDSHRQETSAILLQERIFYHLMNILSVFKRLVSTNRSKRNLRKSLVIMPCVNFRLLITCIDIQKLLKFTPNLVGKGLLVSSLKSSPSVWPPNLSLKLLEPAAYSQHRIIITDLHIFTKRMYIVRLYSSLPSRHLFFFVL